MTPSDKLDRQFRRMAIIVIAIALGWELATNERVREKVTSLWEAPAETLQKTSRAAEPARSAEPRPAPAPSGSGAEATDTRTGPPTTRPECPAISLPAPTPRTPPSDPDAAEPPAKITFDPVVVATSETRMWRAYYNADVTTIRQEVRTLLMEQFGLAEQDATAVENPLISATMVFDRIHSNYEARCLPDLERAYQELKRVSGMSFDPKQAARAKLSWWVARRTPGSDSPAQVGKQIAHLYAVIFGEPRPEFDRAGLLRAEAAYLRDLGDAACDWQKVQQLLIESYTELRKGM